MKILARVTCCRGCPNRQYSSGGVYDCAVVQAPLQDDVQMPAWCPLPDDPAQLAARSDLMLQSAKRVITLARERITDETTPAEFKRTLDFALQQFELYR